MEGVSRRHAPAAAAQGTAATSRMPPAWQAGVFSGEPRLAQKALRGASGGSRCGPQARGGRSGGPSCLEANCQASDAATGCAASRAATSNRAGTSGQGMSNPLAPDAPGSTPCASTTTSCVPGACSWSPLAPWPWGCAGPGAGAGPATPSSGSCGCACRSASASPCVATGDWTSAGCACRWPCASCSWCPSRTAGSDACISSAWAGDGVARVLATAGSSAGSAVTIRAGAASRCVCTVFPAPWPPIENANATTPSRAVAITNRRATQELTRCGCGRRMVRTVSSHAVHGSEAGRIVWQEHEMRT